jgi:hypothetical protein
MSAVDRCAVGVSPDCLVTWLSPSLLRTAFNRKLLGAIMVTKRRCPYTGVVNFFSDEEPFIAVASIIEVGSKTFIWRSYVGKEVVGLSGNIASAEMRLAQLFQVAKDA